MKWTILNAIVVEAETAKEADRKAFEWFEAATFEGLENHRMCGHPMQGEIGGCPCHMSNRTGEGTYSLIHPVQP